MLHSFYLLTIDIEPGGARKNDSYVFSTREEIMEALKRDLEGGTVLFFGGKYVLRVYNEGRKFWEWSASLSKPDPQFIRQTQP